MLLGHPIDLKAKAGGEKSMSDKEEACTRTAGARRRWLHRKPLRPFGYRLLPFPHAAGQPGGPTPRQGHGYRRR